MGDEDIRDLDLGDYDSGDDDTLQAEVLPEIFESAAGQQQNNKKFGSVGSSYSRAGAYVCAPSDRSDLLITKKRRKTADDTDDMLELVKLQVAQEAQRA